MQQRFGERGLAAAGVPNERDCADVFGRVIHGRHRPVVNVRQLLAKFGRSAKYKRARLVRERAQHERPMGVVSNAGGFQHVVRRVKAVQVRCAAISGACLVGSVRGGTGSMPMPADRALRYVNHWKLH
jgi:hypothetical protein